MKKNNAPMYASILFLLAVTLASCKSAPPSETSEVPAPVETEIVPSIVPEPEPVEDKILVDEELTALRDKMEVLRNECLLYKLDSYKASEWTSAEASRTAGLEAYGVDYERAKNAFIEAIGKYESLQQDSYTEIAAELEASIVKARKEAIAAGAQDYYPEQFDLADVAADKALELKQAGELAGSYDEGQIALMRYQTLLKGMQAVGLKKKIDTNQFVQYASTDYEQADIKYQEAASFYGTSDAAALEAAAESVALYKKVNNAGYKVWTENLLVTTKEIRSLCDLIKAEKSMKVEYTNARMKYDEASDYGSEGDWESAFASYSSSTTLFSTVLQEATLKKNLADIAIEAARKRQNSGSDLAEQADEIAPLAEDAEGFSDEPIVIEETVSGEEPK